MRAKFTLLRCILVALLLFPINPGYAATTAVPSISDIPNQTTHEDVPTAAISFTINDPPTISDIPDRTINEDSHTGSISFTIGDLETAATSLTLTGSSNNTTLVPNGSIVFSGSGASRTVIVTPVANQSGTATITINVSDGSLTTSDSFTLTVNAVNDLPTISNVANLPINEDSNTGPIAVTVGDVETPAASLILTGSSNNTTLVPNGNIVIGGSGTSRTVTITPAANQSGTATITLTVADADGGTAAEPFTLTVNAVNDPPTITNIANQIINEGSSTGPLDFEVGDVETPAGDLTVTGSSNNTTLVPNDNIVFGGSDTNRTVTVTPVAGQNGTATITLIVTDDGSSTASDTFNLSVDPVNDPPTISNIGNQTINESANTGAIPFTVSDPDTDVNILTVTGSSNNTALVPDANIIFDGSGANRTVMVTPAAGQNGVATITVEVSDGSGGTDSDSFNVIVNAVNDPPTISDIGNQNINEDGSTGEIAFTVNDPDSPLNTLTLSGSSDNPTLVPNSDTNISFAGTGTNRTVTITPAANQSGTANITIEVTDGTGLDTDTFLLTVNAVNDPPTISDIANQDIDVNTSTGAIPFTVGDPDTDIAVLTPSGSSNNTTLVPNGNIVFGGSGASLTVTVTPAAGEIGTATITVQVSDGSGGTANDTFIVTVSPLLQTVREGGNTDPLAITVGDADNSVAALTLTGTSSNTALVPNGNIVFVGNGNSRTVTITPAPNRHGTTTITITVSNGPGSSSSDTFTLTVNPVNDAPTDITLSNTSVPENQAAGAVVGTLDAVDVDNTVNPDSDPFTFSLAPGEGGTDNASFEIAGDVLKTKATFDFETKSDYSIRIKVTDSGSPGLSFEKAFIVKVTNDNEAPTALDDPYTTRQGSTLTVPKAQGFLSNDTDPDESPSQKGDEYLFVGDILTFPGHAEVFEVLQEENGEYRGAFIYKPEEHFAGIDTFTYLAVDEEGEFSLEATVEITVLDIESPLVRWTEPVTDGVTYDVITGVITLGVEAEDNVSISRVRFLRWDALQNKHIEIGMDYTAPYQVVLDTNTLNWGWNQIFAEAYDNLNNRSNIPYIWLYKNKIPTFLPIIGVPER